MKKIHLNGQVLSGKEMREVKGGYFRSGDDPRGWEQCPNCDHIYNPKDVLEQIIYDPDTGLYGRLCLECGSFIPEK